MTTCQVQTAPVLAAYVHQVCARSQRSVEVMVRVIRVLVPLVLLAMIVKESSEFPAMTSLAAVSTCIVFFINTLLSEISITFITLQI